MPSRFEPCGQGQMIAMRYGTPPVARRTGGLADTIVDLGLDPATGTGFLFDAATSEALIGAVDRARSPSSRPPTGDRGSGWSPAGWPSTGPGKRRRRRRTQPSSGARSEYRRAAKG